MTNAPSWFIDELAHAGSEHLDSTYVPGYDRKAGTDPSADVALLGDLGLSANHTLVDLGAGTGTLALAAAPLCRRVIAVDISPVMLDRLRHRAADLAITNIEYVQQGFLSYDHRGDRADIVYSRHALHHLPDFWKALALARISALLRPGGVLILRDLVFACPLDQVTQVVDAWLARASDSPERGWTRPELETHLRDEYSTFTWLLEPMIEQAGFEIRQRSYDESRMYAAYTCVRRA